MGIIKISKLNESEQATYNLLGYSFQPIETEQVTILEINPSEDSIKYRIWTDENVKELEKITSFISSKFENVLLNNNKVVYLIEEPSRNYIYINTDDEPRKMFSGRRL